MLKRRGWELFDTATGTLARPAGSHGMGLLPVSVRFALAHCGALNAREKSRRYRKGHRTQINAYARGYRADHKAQAAATMRRWRASHGMARSTKQHGDSKNHSFSNVKHKTSMKPIVVLSEPEICAVFGITLPKLKRWQREGAPADSEATEPAIRAWLAGRPGSYSVAPDVTAFVDLPSTAQMVADVIGRDATLLLCASNAVQQRDIYVPLSMQRAARITDVIGVQACALLVAQFGGQHLKLAACSCLARAARKAAIQRAFVSGIAVARLAVIYAVTERLVHYYVRELRNSDTRRNKNATLTLNSDISPLGVGSSDGGTVRVTKQAQSFSSERGGKRRVGTEPSRARSKRGSK
jgi:hypothetical protein